MKSPSKLINTPKRRTLLVSPCRTPHDDSRRHRDCSPLGSRRLFRAGSGCRVECKRRWKLGYGCQLEPGGSAWLDQFHDQYRYGHLWHDHHRGSRRHRRRKPKYLWHQLFREQLCIHVERRQSALDRGRRYPDQRSGHRSHGQRELRYRAPRRRELHGWILHRSPAAEHWGHCNQFRNIGHDDPHSERSEHRHQHYHRSPSAMAPARTRSRFPNQEQVSGPRRSEYLLRGTSISAGTIQFSNNSAFGTGSVTSNGGTIRATSSVTTTNNLVVNSATTLDVSGGNWNLNGNISGSGNITRGTSATLTLYLGGDNSG